MHTLKKRELPSNILRYVLLLLGGAVSVMPMIYMISTSLKPNGARPFRDPFGPGKNTFRKRLNTAEIYAIRPCVPGCFRSLACPRRFGFRAFYLLYNSTDDISRQVFIFGNAKSPMRQ